MLVRLDFKFFWSYILSSRRDDFSDELVLKSRVYHLDVWKAKCTKRKDMYNIDRKSKKNTN